MDYRSPLRHVLHKLLPASADPAARTPDFEDTRPDDSRTRPPADGPARDRAAPVASSIEPFPGTEVMEFPDAAAAELMDEFFGESSKRAA